MSIKLIISTIFMGLFLTGCGGDEANSSTNHVDANQPHKVQRVLVANFNDSSQYHIQSDDEFIFFKIYNYDKNIVAHSQFYLNIDNNTQTGYKNNSGSEYLIEDNRLYKYIGSGGYDWKWELVDTVAYQKIADDDVSKSFISAKVAKSLLENLGDMFSSESVKVSKDWIAISYTPNKRYISQSGDVLASLLFENGRTHYIDLYEYDNRLIFSAVTKNSELKFAQYFLDLDNNSQTGYISNNIGRGFEYLLEEDRVYKYTGGNSGDWSWELVDNGTFGIDEITQNGIYKVESSFFKSSLKLNQEDIKIAFRAYDENWQEIYKISPKEVKLTLELEDGAVYITLNESWNLMGINANLTLQNLKDALGEDNILIIQGGGSVYKKDNPEAFNNFISLQEGSGYQIKLNNEAKLSYIPIVYENNTIPLTQGWNLINPMSNLSLAKIKEQLGENLIAIKGVGDKILYQNSEAQNGFEKFEEPFGYLIKVAYEGELRF